uniref:Uncharacterized protein n=1 Tax=Rhizobium rhizogenes TaxID=359 RepID=A0A7S4ZRL5_RHIRH|nr:hypothetical protein pC5.7c_522 [Rhizobium rhizogenes]QCL09558.1 hypothetical protein pC5.8a_66 [Rhizobium rhizogenes]
MLELILRDAPFGMVCLEQRNQEKPSEARFAFALNHLLRAGISPAP